MPRIFRLVNFYFKSVLIENSTRRGKPGARASCPLVNAASVQKSSIGFNIECNLRLVTYAAEEIPTYFPKNVDIPA